MTVGCKISGPIAPKTASVGVGFMKCQFGTVDVGRGLPGSGVDTVSIWRVSIAPYEASCVAPLWRQPAVAVDACVLLRLIPRLSAVMPVVTPALAMMLLLPFRPVLTILLLLLLSGFPALMMVLLLLLLRWRRPGSPSSISAARGSSPVARVVPGGRESPVWTRIIAASRDQSTSCVTCSRRLAL